MKKLIVVPLIFICALLHAQLHGPKECKWNPEKKPVFHYVLWDDPEPPEAWVKYPSYCSIREVYHAWRIPYGKYDLVPKYILYKTEKDRTVTNFDACQFAYNFFMEHPNRINYYHKEFDFVVERVIAEDR